MTETSDDTIKGRLTPDCPSLKWFLDVVFVPSSFIRNFVDLANDPGINKEIMVQRTEGKGVARIVYGYLFKPSMHTVGAVGEFLRLTLYNTGI